MRPTGDHKMVSAPIDSAQKCEPGDRRLTELGQEIARALTVRRCGASRSHGDFARLRGLLDCRCNGNKRKCVIFR